MDYRVERLAENLEKPKTLRVEERQFAQNGAGGEIPRRSTEGGLMKHWADFMNRCGRADEKGRRSKEKIAASQAALLSFRIVTA